MGVLQSDIQAAIRAQTGKALDYNGDWLALFDQAGIAYGDFNGRMLAYCNSRLGASYADLAQAQNAFAVSQGYSNWASMGAPTFTLASQRLGSRLNGVSVDFTDMSMVIRDTTTPANAYSGSPSTKLLGTALNTIAAGLSLGATDNVYLPTSAFPYSATAFTIIAEASTTALTNNALLALNIGGAYGAGPGALLRIQSNSLTVAAGNATAASKAISPLLGSGEMIKAAACFRTSDNSVSVTNRGQAVATITTGDWNGTSDRLQLGAITSGGVQALVGVLKWFVYLPEYNTALAETMTAA